METKPWYTSKIIWTSVVTALASALALIGHNIDAGTQQVLVDNITAAASIVATVAPVLIALFRTKSDTQLTKGKTQ